MNYTDPKAVMLEDSIMQKGELTTAGSKILEDFISPINANVVERLLDNGYKIVGKTNMDEFGISSIFSDKPDVISGAVKAVADGVVAYSLCNDIYGKYRLQAAENGCCYIHPTYGTVSRYGLIPMVSSMDQIGIICKNLKDGFELLSFIAGSDVNDGAMFPDKIYDYAKLSKNIRIGIPDSIIKKADKDTQEAIQNFAENFDSINIKLENFDVYKQVMYILSCAEISNNINRYDGIKFGYRASSYRGIDELYIKTRTEGFGLQTKLVAIIGSMVLSQNNYVPYYEKAMKVRRLIKESLRFDEYDIIVLPCKISENPYENLSLYSLATLVGLPSISFSFKGQGIQLIANVKNENLLSTIWEVCIE